MLNILIAESEELELGGYEVIGVVGSETEARELKEFDMAAKLAALDSDESPFCPFVYKMYERGMDGYVCVLEIAA